jgi:hypothetical protein
MNRVSMDAFMVAFKVLFGGDVLGRANFLLPLFCIMNVEFE